MKRIILAVACICGWLAPAPSARAVVDGTPPSVQITTPAAGASVSGVVRISVRASDAGGVQNMVLSIDGAPVATADGVASLDYDWDTTQGAEGRSHSVVADAYDTAWNRGRTQISLNVPDLRAPTVAILGLVDGVSVTGTTNVVLSASDAVGIARLVLSIDGQIVSDQSDVQTFTYSWNTSGLTETSQHTLRADAYDPSGNRATQSIGVSIRDVSSPVVTYTTPSGPDVSTSTVDVDVHASDVSGIRQLVLSLDGRVVAQESDGDRLKYSWDASREPAGTRHTLATDAYDQIGHRSSVSRQITITDIEPPSVSIPRPHAAPSVFGLEMVEVAASDNKSVKHLALSIDGTVVQQASDSTGFFYLWETAASGVGTKAVVTVSAEDAAGNHAASSREFTVEAEQLETTGSPLAIPAGSPDGDQTGGVESFFADARSRGAQILYWYLNYANVVANPQALDSLMAHLGAGGDTAITFDLIHSTVLSTFPPPYHSFVEPGFAEQFSDYAAGFAVKYRPRYLFVGNEANLYLASHPDQVDAFRQVIRRTREKIAASGAETRVGVTLNYAGYANAADLQLMRALAADADLVGYTVYGYRVVDTEIRFDDPTVGILMLEDLPTLVPGKAFAVVETGWNTSARFASSESLQTAFVRLLRNYAKRSRAEFIDIFLLEDGVDCTEQALSFSPPGSNPDPNSPEVQDLAEYLCRFGLRHADGSGKSAWNYLGQTKWPIPEPSALSGALVAIGCLALLGRRNRY